MWPFERHAGCPPASETCFGPVGPYWTLFGTELPLLMFHAIAASVLALGVVGAVAWRKRRGASGLSWPRIAGAGALVAVALFFVLAWAFPLTVNY